MYVAPALCRARPGNLSFKRHSRLTEVNTLGAHLESVCHQQHCVGPGFALIVTNCRVAQHLQEDTAGPQPPALCLHRVQNSAGTHLPLLPSE